MQNTQIDWIKVIRRLDQEAQKHADSVLKCVENKDHEDARMLLGVSNTILSISWALQDGLQS